MQLVVAGVFEIVIDLVDPPYPVGIQPLENAP